MSTEYHLVCGNTRISTVYRQHATFFWYLSKANVEALMQQGWVMEDDGGEVCTDFGWFYSTVERFEQVFVEA
jgi:hypothetical protein